MKILYVVNPAAGKGKINRIVPMIRDICNENHIDYDLRYTEKPEDGTLLAKNGVDEGFDRIIAVGGDGTINEIVNGIAESNAVLGVIPGGTGNDFIRSIQPKLDLRQTILRTINGEIRNIDLAKSNDRYFINIGSGGFDAEVALQTIKIKKIFPGSTAYIIALIKTIFSYNSTKIKVRIDNIQFEKDTLLVAVANGKYYGGGILAAPRADVDDGEFDICFLEKMPKIKMLLLFPKYIHGQHEGIKGVSFYRGKEVRLVSEKDFPVNIDGEVFLKKDADFKIIPKGISVIS